ncbi:MarR family transcriptional regulator [Altererythrobacter soli]|uniref:MarR family transcriptional regulator n=1 Tax=Croceibacterium soli TaxID=1739690 RepID=A0A6I4UUW0_9SPHN|nr:MarR family transcriptional regulator [Croceibacterium soli]MXP41293.1 MarR family transcriptional regulator [Croceibacterium soli]
MPEGDADPNQPSASPGLPAGPGDAALMEPFLHKPGFLLARVDQISTALFAGAPGGTTLRQAEFLMLVGALGPMPQIRLANASGMDTSTTAYVVANLESRGLVERAPCPDDRRRSQVSLTRAGGNLLREVTPRYAELQQQLGAPLAEADRGRLRTMLHTLGADARGPGPIWTPACDPAGGVLDKALSFLARRALQVFQAQFVADATHLNLTLRQFSLLFLLSQRETLTQVAFARLFGLDPSTCGVIMRSLAGRGLIGSASSHEDRRERVFTITPAGRQALAEVHPLAHRSEMAVLRGFAPAEQAILIRQLQAVVKTHSPALRFPGAIAAL